MDIKFYNNNSEKIKVGKNLTNEVTISGELKNSSDILNPTLVLTGENLSTYNYFYIPSFGRYYFVTDIRVLRTNLWEIDGKCDVLESYKTQIRQQRGVIKRQEKEYDMYLNDTMFKTEAYDQISTLEFPSGFSNTNNFLLVVCGGN